MHNLYYVLRACAETELNDKVSLSRQVDHHTYTSLLQLHSEDCAVVESHSGFQGSPQMHIRASRSCRELADAWPFHTIQIWT